MSWQKLKLFTLIFSICGLMLAIGFSQRLTTGTHDKTETVPVATESSPQSSSLSGAPKIPLQISQNFIQLSRKVTQSVVSIEVDKRSKKPKLEDDNILKKFFNIPYQLDRSKQPFGSGVVIDKAKGHIVTNHHVIDEADDIQVTLQNKQKLRARVIGTDEKSDLAIIQVKPFSSMENAVFGDSNLMKVGEWVLAIGSPFGLSSSVTAGIVSAKGRADVGIADFEDFIQTDAAINPGNSGGALVNTRGEVIGINTSLATRSSSYMGIGFAIPSNMVKKISKALIEHGRVSRSQLGVYIRQMEPVLAKSLGLKNINRGIVVTDVISDSPAELAGLKKYDVILKLNQQEVNDINRFRNKISLTPPGTKIVLKVWRNGKEFDVNPELREATPAKNPGSFQKAFNQMEEKIGFKVKTMTPETAEKLQIPIHHGVEVASVQQISKAFEEGLSRGNIILEVNRKAVHTVKDFIEIVQPLKKGDVLLLSVLQDGETRLIAYELD